MKFPLLALFAGFALLAAAQDKPANVLGSSTGRYVFGQTSQLRADQFLLDTQTGRIWRMVADGSGVILEPVYVLTLSGTRLPFPLTVEQEIAESSRIERAKTNAAAAAASITLKYFGTNAPPQFEDTK